MRRLSTRAAGLLILILGIWGGLVPFIGPYFHFTMGPTKSWTWTTGRLWLDVLPGAVAVLGGLILLGAGPRLSGKLGALMAIAAGIWFAIGPDMSLLWNAAGAQGAAHGAKGTRVLEMLTYHTLLGSVIAALGAYALPGLVTRRKLAAAEEEEAAYAGSSATAGRPVRSARRDVAPAAVGAGTGAVAGEAVAHRHAADREDEPVAADGYAGNGHTRHEDDGLVEPATSERSAVDGESEARTAVIDRGSRGDQVDSPGGEPAAADSAGAAPGTSEPGTVRRRQGGLLSRLRS